MKLRKLSKNFQKVNIIGFCIIQNFTISLIILSIISVIVKRMQNTIMNIP